MIEINRALSREDAIAVPVGTIVESIDSRLKAVRTYVGWMDNNRRHYPAQYLTDNIGSHRLVALGDTPRETLNQFRQRLRTVALGRAYASGVDRGPVHRIFAGCNIGEFELSVGMWVDFSDQDLNEALPNNTIAQTGTPEVWALYGVYRLHQGDWHWLTGGNFNAEGAKIIDLPGHGVADWCAAEWTEADDQAIEELKALVLHHGAEAKSSAGWCSQYEYALARLCIAPRQQEHEDEEEGEEEYVAPANQWVDADRGAFQVGDRITRRNRPHTLAGRGDYQEGTMGEVGTILREASDMYLINGERQFGGQWGVRWESGRGSTIDGDCIMLAEQEFVEGARVARAYGQTLRYDGFECDNQADQGDIGVVSRTRTDGHVEIRWSNGHQNVYSADCLEAVRPPNETTQAEPETSERPTFQAGDRVRITSRYWVSDPGADPARYNHLAPVGSVGVVEDRHLWEGGHDCALVRWDHSNHQTRVNVACLEYENQPTREPQAGDRVRLITRFTYRGSGQDDYDRRFGVVGDEGIVIEVDEDYLNVTWPNGSDPDFVSYVDRECVEVVATEDETAEVRPLEVGDRVRRRPGNYSISDMDYNPRWEQYCSPGDVGEVVDISPRLDIVRVRWANSPDEAARIGGRRIDASCVEVIETNEPERAWRIGDRVELISEYTYHQGRRRPHIAEVGARGVVSALNQPDDMVEVRWSGQHVHAGHQNSGRFVDPSCLRLVSEATS